MFQSLGRDSVCSYEDYSVDELAEEMFQSLGRDSVCSYERAEETRARTSSGFNPSVGILFVHTIPRHGRRQ